jgi:hypothetical protein
MLYRLERDGSAPFKFTLARAGLGITTSEPG